MVIASSILLVAVSLWLGVATELGSVYGMIAAILGAGFLVLACRMKESKLLLRAWQFYCYSIFYIVSLFGAIVASRLLSS